MGRWSLSYDGFEPEKEKLRETLCTLGNGYVCTRGRVTCGGVARYRRLNGRHLVPMESEPIRLGCGEKVAEINDRQTVECALG